MEVGVHPDTMTHTRTHTHTRTVGWVTQSARHTLKGHGKFVQRPAQQPTRKPNVTGRVSVTKLLGLLGLLGFLG